MRQDTAGDPITGMKWSRRTTRKIAEELTAWGIAVSKNTVGRLLKEMDFKLRVNRKQIASRTTRTESGLTVNAYLIPENYETGIKIPDAEMRRLNLVPHDMLGSWNYTVRPTQNVN